MATKLIFISRKDESEGVSEEDEVNAKIPIFNFPTESQIAQARLLATEQEATFVQIQVEYDKQKTIMSDIEKRLRTAEETLFKTKAILAGIYRLPPEILGEIFIFHVRANLQSAWTLMQVSRAWRSAALSTRALWGAIMLSPSMGSKMDKTRARVYKGKEVCFKLNQVTRALARAGPTPLDLFIGSEFKERRVSGRRIWNYKASYAIENLLLSHMTNGPEKKKLRSLEIETNGYKVFGFGNKMDKFDLTTLESLKLEYMWPELIDRVQKEAKGMRRLVAMSSDIQKLVGVRWLGQLEELEILNHRNISTDAAAIRSILSEAQSLNSLLIDGGQILDKDLPKSTIEFPKLQRLVLRKVHDFWPFDAPNVTHLTIECSWEAPRQMERNSINLPHLKVFHFNCMNSLECLLAFVVPSLQEFSLWGRDSRQQMRTGMEKVWIQNNSPNINPVSFTFRHATTHHQVVADTISKMTNLEALHIEYVTVTTPFLNQLQPQRGPPPKKVAKNKKEHEQPQTRKNPPWVVRAPKMKVLTMDFAGSKMKNDDAEAYEKAARELLAKRKHSKTPMEKIEIRLSADEGWTVFEDE